MTSTFGADLISSINEEGRIPIAFNDLANESETEDEEIRINCIGGFRGVDDSDVNTDHSECGDDVLSEDEIGDRYVRSQRTSFFIAAHCLLSN